jgi:hypothetical protein
MSFESQREPTPDAAMETDAAPDAQQRPADNLAPVGEPASAPTGGGVLLAGASRTRAPERVRCALCRRRIEHGQRTRRQDGALVHDHCVPRSYRPASARAAVPASPQHSDDAMEDGQHALRSAALLLQR